MRPATVSVTGVGTTTPVILDLYIPPENTTFSAVVNGTVTYNVEYSVDDPFATYTTDYNTNATWYVLTGASALTANASTNTAFPARALRARITAGTGSVTMTVIQAGITT